MQCFSLLEKVNRSPYRFGYRRSYIRADFGEGDATKHFSVEKRVFQ